MILHIKVIEAKDVPKMDVVGYSDPYVKFTYDKGPGTYQTRYIEQTLTPVWNEEFHIAILDKKEGLIKAFLYDFDKVSNDDLISTKDFPINSFQIGKVVDNWYEFVAAPKAKKPGCVHLVFHLALPSQTPFCEDRTAVTNAVFCKLRSESFTPEQLQNFQNIFKQVDSDHDGSISLSETREFFDKIGINPVLAPVAFVLSNKDVDSNISYSDLEPFYKYLSDIEDEPINVYRTLFHKFDRDNSGYLDQKEVRNLIYFFGGNEWGENDAQRFIQSHDEDNDGKLNFEEVCYLLDNVLSRKKDLVIKEKQVRNNTLESQLEDTLSLIAELKEESIQMHKKLELAESKLKLLKENH